MKDFFKFMFASMLGFILTLVVITIILSVIVASMVTFMSTEEVSVPDNSVLQIKLDMSIMDRGPKPAMFINLSPMGKREGLNEILDNIHKAKADNNIKGILLDIGVIPAGISTVDEIRDALIDFKKSGKFIFSYGEFYTQKAYYLASVSDKICLQPQGMILFKGIDAELTFYKGTLDKLDIKMQVIRHGKFKSATEPLFLDKMSPENREQITALIKNTWEKIIEGISVTRNISPAELNRVADSLNAQEPEDALKYKLIDKLVYRDELLNDLKEKLGISVKKELSLITLEKYMYAPDPRKKQSGKDGKIAVIFATGQIGSGNGNDEMIGSERLSKAIRKAKEDKKVKAIVFRVNSPGGSSLASDVIWREISLAAKEKPVVASFGDVAASGGYYIACPATRIVADPTTITGSIGVFAVVPNMKGLFNNKLGITFDHAKTNQNSDFIGFDGPLPSYQEKKLQMEIENIYSSFISKVAEGRHLTKAKVDSIGQGRVWSGVDAIKIGLIDEFGGLDKAIEVAAGLAKISDYRLIGLPEQKDPFFELLDELTGNESSSAVEKELGDFYKYYQYLKEVQQMKGIQARLPFEITIN